ncbi:MAG TPA: AAA family ATPase, partial [Ignavibacteria bacterium]
KNQFLKGVFSLNQKNDLIDKNIAKEEGLIETFDNYIKEKIALKNSLVVDRKETLTRLLDSCWSPRSVFSTYTKLTLAHTGSKPNHLAELKHRIPLLGQIKTIQQISETYKLLFEQELKEVKYKVDVACYKQIRRNELKLEKLLQEVIIGNEDVDIAGLINSLNARSWVEKGIEFIDKTDGICPFCQKGTIDEDLKEKFNKYFDQSYKEKIDKIKSLKSTYEEKTKEFLNNIAQIQNDFNPKNIVSNLYLGLVSLFNSNIAKINEKLSRSNEKKSIVSLLTHKKDLSKIINGIQENNKLFSDLDNKKNELINNIWNYIASNCKSKIDEFEIRESKYKRIEALADHLINTSNIKLNSSKSTIETLRSQTINTKDAVDSINVILQYSGFEGFEIKEKDIINNISQYYLKRTNDPGTDPIFKSLSEGERNFISFLYFYQLCLGTDDIQKKSTKKKIIVIDDPVSSLDCQTLFVVSTLIQNLIIRKGNSNRLEKMDFKNETIDQVFILTHNIYFYKEVAFERRPICTDYWHYKITKVQNLTRIIGDYNRTISDDYTLLWKTIKELKINLPVDSTLNILIANTMRRIIESYVNFIGYSSESWGALYNLDQSDPLFYIKSAFISIINEESHKITALESIYYQKIIHEHPQVLFDVFKEIFKTIGKEHYEIMLDEEII